MEQQYDPNTYTYPFQLTKTLHRDPYDDLLPTNPENSQKGKIVIITGAYGGIGAATASVWARAGASVVLTGRKADQLLKVERETNAVATDPSTKIISVPVDITIESQVKNLYDQVQKTFGRPANVLINNAGSPSGGDGPFATIPWDDFTTILASHYLGAALMSKYFISGQPDPKDPVGTIVYISSGLGCNVFPGFSSYSIAKHAGMRLMEYLDTEYANLRAFSLAPGIIQTGMTDELFKPFAKDHIELPGMWSVYLSQERADYLRGGFVGVNWDIKELEEHKDEIVEKKLLKMKGVPAKMGKGGHPWGT